MKERFQMKSKDSKTVYQIAHLQMMKKATQRQENKVEKGERKIRIKKKQKSAMAHQTDKIKNNKFD